MDFSDWSPKDYTALGTALGATYADVQSTKDLIKRGGGETNPIYGTPHPSGAALDQGGLVGAGIAAAVAHGLPEKYRGAFLGGWTGLEGGLAIHNSKLGKDGPKTNLQDAVTDALAPAALGALAGYFLPSGKDSGQVTPVIGPHEIGVGYTKNFAKGGPVMPPLPKNVRRVTFGRTRKLGTKRKGAIRIAR